MRVSVYNYGHKADNLVKAIEQEGHHVTRVLDDADVFLVDTDTCTYGDRPMLLAYAATRKIPIVVYPHAGHVRLEYDGVVEPWLPVALHLVPAPGWKQVMERFMDRRIEVCGWFYTPVRPFAPTEPKQVLFAPKHPYVDGVTTPPGVLRDNIRAFELFRDMPQRLKKCRYIGERAANGLPHFSAGISMLLAQANNSFHNILEADLVIASETYAAMSVALGKPTVMFNQDEVGHESGGFPAHYSEYRSKLRYPYDIDDGPFDKVVEHALAGGPALDRWRADMIGDQMDPRQLVSLLESVL